ncbi:MAG: cytochrome c biogenesis protein CcsA [Dehalococcoidia bacterium]|jgi:heme exporter protein C|nr:cytochrome C assembly protein [Chloroflexota bacterium]MBE32073.1 cytochrome C assembly protein [Rickettsiales bacterium]
MFRNLYLIISGAAVILSIWMIFMWVPTEINQGLVQRILYVHVPFAWASMVAIIAVAFASLMFLITKKTYWDNLAQSLAEVGVVCAVVMLFSGIVWAKPVWGIWWTGEAKLTTALILFLIYCAYLVFRNYFPPGDARNRIAAIIALIGAIDSPIIYYAAQIWQENHPQAVVGPLATQESSLSSEMVITLLTSVLAVTLMFIGIVWVQYQTNKLLGSNNV